MDVIALAAALCVAGAIVLALLAIRRSTTPGQDLERRLGRVLGSQDALQIATAGAEALKPQKAGWLPVIGALLEGKAWTEETAARLESADVRLTVSEFLALRGLLAVVGGLAGLLLLNGVVGLLAMLVLGFVGFSLPNFFVNRARSKRQQKISAQLPDALSMISNSLKAGFGLMQALDLASRELQHPIATELKRMIQDVSVGASREAALQKMAKRSGNADLDIVVTAMLVQQSTGGNLSEILDSVGHTMRERTRIKGEIRTLTSQQMMTGYIIGGLPVFMLGAFSLVSPDYMSPLFHETAGNLILATAAIMQFFGAILIKRILAIEV